MAVNLSKSSELARRNSSKTHTMGQKKCRIYLKNGMKEISKYFSTKVVVVFLKKNKMF